VRAPDGAITTFDPVGSTFTIPGSINPAGAIVGIYFSASGPMPNGFLRAPDGAITTFAATPYSINPTGEITGIYGEWHGFVRLP
jgi:hypothetical protein